MQIQFVYKNRQYSCDLSRPLDISIPVGNVNCFYAPPAKYEPLRAGDFIGAVKEGSPVNFFNVKVNPHGNGTHTEGLGHITLHQETIGECLKQFHFVATLVSVKTERINGGDEVITSNALKAVLPQEATEALIIRTMPNKEEKMNRDYSGTNPPYLAKGAMELIVALNIQHLLLDLPSVDREKDDGKIENHRLFWNVDSNKAAMKSRKNCTITELIHVPDSIKDGRYLINLQVAPFAMDAAPSKPVLYQLKEIEEKHGLKL